MYVVCLFAVEDYLTLVDYTVTVFSKREQMLVLWTHITSKTPECELGDLFCIIFQ